MAEKTQQEIDKIRELALELYHTYYTSMQETDRQGDTLLPYNKFFSEENENDKEVAAWLKVAEHFKTFELYHK